MPIELPPGASDVFDQGNQYALDNGLVFAYGLKEVTTAIIQETCNQATESYAKEILGWPNGRLAKPEIFSSVKEDTLFENLGDCTKHFVRYLHDLFKSSPPKMLPTYPHAFIAVSKEEDSRDKIPSHVILVLAHKSHGQWQLEHRSVPLQVKLGLSVSSLTMGDVTAEDILDEYDYDGQAKTTKQE
ncbi:uncharacterized protein PFLUO_LOCUS7393 [Penicillium psychrofluorescens]|uniref:uncharacterized protein n=1 Tax=Penicillium psychrofluorescens TaxID=3158075 RepID=UPI003CCCE877